MDLNALVYKIEEYLNMNFLIEKRIKESSLINNPLQEVKRSDLDDEKQTPNDN